MKTLQLLVKGKVQGVFFRATAKEMARKMNLKGWVKNTREGDVEILASGNDDDLGKFIQWCWLGPDRAQVSTVEVKEVAMKDLDDFSILR